ncbi:lytic transglycosylase domain-containing protein [Pelagerythrobacter rhizovicinus]|uniref:Lytic transglycosylase domain-containing protein n=1 Tax=Pelagerythrobacter rhizovicinus TaxID=2268576 RepID=A0A4Q2KKL7_9SPHN|nr:lytic transglycosylase domain-containing protein [Pelagerythrobacter rhizovicinus]RXZ65835.1 lytic transglycosylase domain-containing protein [Pelagerythrobacter rhizovicinus]
MSSMTRIPLYGLAFLATTVLTASVPLVAQQDAIESARHSLVATVPSQMGQAVERWKFLTSNDRMGFASYAGFALAYPEFPRMDLIRANAEKALESGAPTPEQLVAYFDRNPPLSNPARARYALALAGLQRPEAFETARAAWRGGDMSTPAEAYMHGLFGSRFTPEDHDARMAALLWQGKADAAARHMANVSPAYRDTAMARLSLIQGQNPASAGLPVPANARTDPGYVYTLARYYRSSGQLPQAIDLLANRPTFAGLPFDAQDFVTEALRIARGAGARPAVQIASKVDDLFAPGADISGMSYRLRDDYTSLMWLGGTKALWSLGEGNTAAPLFYRYGAAARTPQTRSKGFYWAGFASDRAGNAGEARRYWEMAAQYPEYYYGLLALERLGRPKPTFGAATPPQPTAEQRAAFRSNPLALAVRELARGSGDWRTERYFFTALAESADDAAEMQLVAELAQELRLPELAVVIGRTAPEKNIAGFERIGFPTVSQPTGTDFTIVHAIARQESEFDQDRVSHAGARGLMQLMPGTAREQAGKLGMSYNYGNLTSDPHYNVRLGNAYFARMMDNYGGSYPLAVAAYNAGPGNVNKWLRQNGDPRTGAVDWLRWIEEIPYFETKNYVQRVLENAVVYETMYPDRVRYGQPKGISQFLGKSTPG